MKTKLAALFAALAAAACFSSGALAAESLTATNAWVRAPAPGQKIVGAYLELTSSRAGALAAVSSPVASRVEMHTMTLEDGVMRMRAVERIDLPAKATVKLAPGGLHLMLIDLKQSLKAGDKVPLMLTLRVPGAPDETLAVEADVRSLLTVPVHRH